MIVFGALGSSQVPEDGSSYPPLGRPLLLHIFGVWGSTASAGPKRQETGRHSFETLLVVSIIVLFGPGQDPNLMDEKQARPRTNLEKHVQTLMDEWIAGKGQVDDVDDTA